jgi:membrane-bound serine protease (ClpP class)
MQHWLSIGAAALLLWPASGSASERVGLIRINGAIGPATASYTGRAIQRSAAAQATCLVIELDTPGGLLDSTKEIVQCFYAAPLPVVVYVAPAPAGAISAGCFLTLAADVAAMAPDTMIGAAHPVAIGGVGDQAPDPVMAQKLESFATTYIETIAQRHRRNAQWAKSAVKESASITAERALELNVIDLIAADRAALLRALDGREVRGHVLRTASAEWFEIPMLTREKWFQLLWRPEVMFLLMLVAIYGIIGELSNPGAILPGVAGAIALILALYMGAILPVNLAGAALLLLAIGLFVADVFAPTHGVLTVGGIVSFFLGSLMLFDRAEAGFRLPTGLILVATGLTAAFFVFVIGAGLRAQFLPVRVGREAMVGQTTFALTPIGPADGRVFVEGELWAARSDQPVAEGAAVEIVAVQGLTLVVKPKA